jgi:hypothetical protein
VSEENVELVRSVYSDWARGDFSDSSVFHPDLEFEMVDWPEGARARGLDEMRRAWRGALYWDPEKALEATELEPPT